MIEFDFKNDNLINPFLSWFLCVKKVKAFA